MEKYNYPGQMPLAHYPHAYLPPMIKSGMKIL